jgi:hypothetical protein
MAEQDFAGGGSLFLQTMEYSPMVGGLVSLASSPVLAPSLNVFIH